jgi:hypothetical protein
MPSNVSNPHDDLICSLEGAVQDFEHETGLLVIEIKIETAEDQKRSITFKAIDPVGWG